MHFTLISDPRITRCGIVEAGDRLVDVAQQGEIVIAQKRAAANPWHSFVRSETLERLLTAARNLPAGVHLCLEEGYRPLHVQQLIFDEYLELLRSELGPIGADRLAVEATKYVARPAGAPPHSTGGAVDVTLLSGEGGELDMGSTSDDTPLQNGNRNYMHSRIIMETARQNRITLAAAMTGAGFVNYPAEWWHWSYGDQYWAVRSRHPRAVYDAVPVTGDSLSPPPVPSRRLV